MEWEPKVNNRQIKLVCVKRKKIRGSSMGKENIIEEQNVLYKYMKERSTEIVHDYTDLIIGKVCPLSTLLNFIVSSVPDFKLAFDCYKILYVSEKMSDLSKKTGSVIALFEDENKRTENALRLMDYITKSDTEKKLDFIINAVRAYQYNKEITEEIFFRIIDVISGTLYEDLIFLAENISKEKIKGNINVIALAEKGMVIKTGFEGEDEPEDQEYTITKLGKWVVRYAISYGEEKE